MKLTRFIMKLYIRRNENEYGPYPIEQVKQLLQEGRLLKNDQASEDKNIWLELDLFLTKLSPIHVMKEDQNSWHVY